MIEIEIRHLGDHEILHAMPAGKRDKPLPVVVLSWIYLIEAGLQLLCGRAGAGRFSRGDAGCA